MQGEVELDVDAAVHAVLAERPRLPALPSERVRVEAAGGRVLAETLRSRWPLPSAPLSIMDGYAVHSGDLQLARSEGAQTLTIEQLGESAAGHPGERRVEPGTCQRISTGAVLPEGADAVVPQEDTRRREHGERVFIELSSVALAQSAPGKWVRPIGSDVGLDERLLERGCWLGPGELALLASTGHPELPVLRRPRVALLASGDELVAIGSTPGRGQIVSTNTLMLSEQILEAGAEPLDLGPVEDRPEALHAALLRARDEADLLICTGGISVGDHDLVLPALRALGFELVFRRVALRPGRPTTFGRLPRSLEPAALPVLALPGNPASTFVAFELLARPLLRAWLDLPRASWQRRTFPLELAAPVEGDRKREHFVRVQIDEQGRARPLAQQLSGALRSLAEVDALLRIPAGHARADVGERFPALLLRA